jgi:hypothetical protein
MDLDPPFEGGFKRLKKKIKLWGFLGFFFFYILILINNKKRDKVMGFFRFFFLKLN